MVDFLGLVEYLLFELVGLLLLKVVLLGGVEAAVVEFLLEFGDLFGEDAAGFV